MSFNPSQFRQVIKDTLFWMDPKLYKVKVRELLMLTCANESNFGSYLYQDDGDPEVEENLAAGCMQVEPMTCDDIVNRVIAPRYPRFPLVQAPQLIWDIRSSIIIARCKYLPFPEHIPSHTDIKGLASYYKRYYNTSKGKASTNKAARKYKKYCL